MKKFKIIKQIGKGSFGKVQLALHIESEEKVAIKTISKLRLKTKEDIRIVNKQIAVFKALHHQNIVRLFQILEDDAHLYMVMEHMEKGDILSQIKQNGAFSEDKTVNYMKQLAEAVRYLHAEKNIAHRDIKLANILLDGNGNVKLADFGLSNFYDENQKLLKTSCGSPCYSAPQILRARKYKPLPVDVWSLGVVFYAMIQGNLPFYHENVKQMYKQVIKGKYVPMQRASPYIKELIKFIFQINPQERLTINQLIRYLDQYSENKQSITISSKSSMNLIPKLSNQSNQYVQNIKLQTIIKILKYNSYNIEEIENAIQHRKNNKRALKFNHLNTFIQLLERKTFNKLKLMLGKYCICDDENQLEILSFGKQLQRTQSTFTRDTLKSSTRIQKKQQKTKFVRNGLPSKLQVPRKTLQRIQTQKIIFQQKIIKTSMNTSISQHKSPLKQININYRSIAQPQYSPGFVKNLSNGYIKLNNSYLCPIMPQDTKVRNTSIDSIKYSKNTSMGISTQKISKKYYKYRSSVIKSQKSQQLTLYTDRTYENQQKNYNNSYQITYY